MAPPRVKDPAAAVLRYVGFGHTGLFLPAAAAATHIHAHNDMTYAYMLTF